MKLGWYLHEIKHEISFELEVREFIDVRTTRELCGAQLNYRREAPIAVRGM
jgi:hypothetical protein